MDNIKPIEILKDIDKITDICQKVSSPVFLTKYGYSHLVIMNIDVYKEKMLKSELYDKLIESEKELENKVNLVSAETVFKHLRLTKTKKGDMKMTIENEIKNSRDIMYLSNTYILDDKCIKNREGQLKLTKKEIKERIKNFDNISIQTGDLVEMYVDEELKDYIQAILDNENIAFCTGFYSGKIIVNTKDGEMENLN